MKKLLPFLLAIAAFGQIEPDAGKWSTKVISSVAEYRVPEPPKSSTSKQELYWLRSFIATNNEATLAQIKYWDAGSPGYRWLQILLNRLKRQSLGNPGNTRALAMLNVAIYDATLAAWDNKYAYQRIAPAVTDKSLPVKVFIDDDTPSYPSEHAVAAGAASALLSYLFPQDSKVWEDLAQEAGRSRLFAGANYPSDVSTGLDLGTRVATKVINRAMHDGSSVVWSGTVPTTPGSWNGVNPISPAHGTWTPWVIASGSQFRPAPPPAYNSDQKRNELAEIKAISRTFDVTAGAMFWQTFDGIFSFWYDLATQRIFENHLDTNAPRAARVYALASLSHADSSISCWDAKYEYWAIRPFQLDTNVTTLFATPNHPSFPAAHGCYSGAIARTIATLFPGDGEFVDAKATEAAESRIAAGIHFRSDVVAGLDLGRKVAATVLSQAASDGSGGPRAK